VAVSGRARLEGRQRRLSQALLVGITLALMVAAGHLRLRLDLTEDGQFSLAPATHAVLDRLEDRLQVKLYFNRDIEGAEALLPARLVLQDFLEEVEASSDRVSVETVDPTVSVAARSAAEAAGISAIPVPTADTRGASIVNVYQGVELRYLDRTEILPVLVPGEIEFAFAAAVDALLREQRPVIGFFSREPAMPPAIPDVAPQVPPDRVFEALRIRLGQRYAVRDVELGREKPKLDGLAALVVARPEGLNEAELFELDQFLASGGHVLVLYDSERIDLRTNRPVPIQTGVDDWLARYGVKPMPQLLWDEQAFPFPIPGPPVTMPDGRSIPGPGRLVNYGLWPMVQDGGLAEDHVVSQGLANLCFLWAHGLVLDGVPEGVDSEVLVASSERTGLLSGELDVEPYLENIAALEQRARFGGEPRSYALVVALRGAFPSAFAGQPAPKPEREVVSAAAPGLLVVVGDSDLFTNKGIEVASDQLGPGGNPQLAANLFDWLCQEEGLIELRVRGGKRRALRSFGREYLERAGGFDADLSEARRIELQAAADRHDRSMRRRIGWANVLLPPLLVLLLGLGHVAYHRARARRPYRPVADAGGADSQGGAAEKAPEERS